MTPQNKKSHGKGKNKVSANIAPQKVKNASTVKNKKLSHTNTNTCTQPPNKKYRYEQEEQYAFTIMG